MEDYANKTVHRGEIYLIAPAPSETVGSEQIIRTKRPAIIVSNDMGNTYGPTVEIVFLTSQMHKKKLPTHVAVACRQPSIALCEQITTVAKSRIGEYIRTATNREMLLVDRALKTSIGIADENPEQVKLLMETIDEKDAEIIALREKIKQLEEQNEKDKMSESLLTAVPAAKDVETAEGAKNPADKREHRWTKKNRLCTHRKLHLRQGKK